MTNKRLIRIGLCQYPLEPVSSVTAWVNKMDRWLTEADLARADLAVFSEYAALELLSSIPNEPAEDFATRLRRATPLFNQYSSLCRDLATRHGLWLLSGSCPALDGDEFRNRVWLCSPTGGCEPIDKLQVTSVERQWGIRGGSASRAFHTPLGCIGAAIGDDSELPTIVQNLVKVGAEVILVPSCAGSLASAHRVRIACQARALENLCYVAQSATVGSAPWVPSLGEHHGRAGAYCPPHIGMSEQGIIVEGQLDEPGWVFGDLDLDFLAKVRDTGQLRNRLDWDHAAHLVGKAATTVLQ
ncbi:MAG TPA: nitrilase-related carbon-nitrogen hydrolase [Polyangiaceae bacterium]